VGVHTGVVSVGAVDVVVGGDVVTVGAVLVHPPISKNPSINIARNPVICQFFIIFTISM
jgi:hypothetical protein